jgi:chemotaxis protein methyltransferase CheR
MSITIHDFLQFNSGYNLAPSDFVILATDLSSRVLAKAMAGEYNEFEVNRGLSDMQKNVYFTRTASSWIIKDYIKSIIEFRRVNLVEPVSYLGAFDVIFCRNVLIYFDIKTRQQIFDQFHKMLNEGGIMILGSTENIFGISDKFESVHEGESVYYRKIGA